jgi:hypothetical protein
VVKVVHLGDRTNPPAGQRYFLIECFPTSGLDAGVAAGLRFLYA